MRYSNPKKAPTLSHLFSLKSKSALVIGGAGLLGGEISYGLAELGAEIIVASRDLKKTSEFVRNLSEKIPGRHLALEVDITSSESIENLFAAISQANEGKLDILVNSGMVGRKNTFDSISDEDWDADIDVGLSGVFRTIKAATPLLAKQKGVILSIASMYGHVAPDHRMYDSEKYANPPSYGVAKAGVIQLTKYISSFLSPQGIRANCISPGPFPYETTQIENPEFIARLGNKNPLERIGVPHEIKGAAALLCSDASSYMTGQNICVDGGWSVW